jgi:uncharacterized protein with PIN domain
MLFAADRMLGKLAKWLRLLGYDTVYSNSLSDDEFLALAGEGRVLLTRNTKLTGRVKQDRLFFVHDNDPDIQLQEVIHGLGLKPMPDRFFARCTVCNGLLESVEAVDAWGHVPDYVWTAHHRFSRCRGCGRFYWPGSHVERSLKRTQRLLEP